MNDETIVALAKTIKKAALTNARGKLAPGIYDIDATIQLSGTIRVAEDEEYIPTTHLPIILIK